MGPSKRILTTSVHFLYQERNERDTYDVKAKGLVDLHGHVSIIKPTPHAREAMEDWQARERAKCEDMREALVDNGLAEWRAIGAGDSELYATPELMRSLEPALSALPAGWRVWLEPGQ